MNATSFELFIGAVRIAMITLWRVFQIMVVVPSSIVGSLLLISALNGQSPVMDLVTGIHDWAVTSVSPAPADTVLVDECVQQRQPEGTSGEKEAIKPVLCELSETKAIPVDEYAQSISLSMRTCYRILIMLAFAFVCMAYPGRRLIGLKERPAALPNETVTR